MIETHRSRLLRSPPLRVATATRLVGRGRLQVETGVVWLTRHGDLQDYRLEAGDSWRLRARDRVVVEPWQADQPATLHLQPVAVGVRVRQLAATAAGGLADLTFHVVGVLRRAERRLASR